MPYRFKDKRAAGENRVVVKRGGRDYVVTVNGNPLLAQAVNGRTNPDSMEGAIGKAYDFARNVNGYLSSIYTTLNPDFVAGNFFRDAIYANTITWVREEPAYAARYNANFARLCKPGLMLLLLDKSRRGTLGAGGIEGLFADFLADGGETGYTVLREQELLKRETRNAVKVAAGKAPARKAWEWLCGVLGELNRSVELAARFAAYVTSRETGRARDRSAYDAKEVSVNFNKKGSGGKFVGQNGQTWAGNTASLVSGAGRIFYVFWNAAIQGTTNFGRAAKRHPARAAAAAAGWFALGMLMSALGGGDGDGDDEEENGYFNLPGTTRRSNVVFGVGGGNFVSVPLSVEYRVFYGMGELAMSVFSCKERMRDSELAMAVASQLSQALPLDPLGDGGAAAFVPSLAKTAVEAGRNKSWTGMPIWRETPWDGGKPEWAKAYRNANTALVGTAKALSDMTGGDDHKGGVVDINPAAAEYLLRGYAGGLWNMAEKFAATAETAAGAREFEPRNIPLLNRVVKRNGENAAYRRVNNEFFRYKKEAEETERLFRAYAKDARAGKVPAEKRMAEFARSVEGRKMMAFRAMRPYIEELDGLLNDPAVPAGRKDEIERRRNEARRRLVQRMEEISKAAE